MKDFVLTDQVTNKKSIVVAESVCCQDIKVGDLIVLHSDTIVPADCLLLAAPSTGGECFVQTGQLDGERSLKPKFVAKSVEM